MSRQFGQGFHPYQNEVRQKRDPRVKEYRPLQDHERVTALPERWKTEMPKGHPHREMIIDLVRTFVNMAAEHGWEGGFKTTDQMLALLEERPSKAELQKRVEELEAKLKTQK